MSNLNMPDLTTDEMLQVTGGSFWHAQCFLAGASLVFGAYAMNVMVVTFCLFYIHANCID